MDEKAQATRKYLRRARVLVSLMAYIAAKVVGIPKVKALLRE